MWQYRPDQSHADGASNPEQANRLCTWKTGTEMDLPSPWLVHIHSASRSRRDAPVLRRRRVHSNALPAPAGWRSAPLLKGVGHLPPAREQRPGHDPRCTPVSQMSHTDRNSLSAGRQPRPGSFIRPSRTRSTALHKPTFASGVTSPGQ